MPVFVVLLMGIIDFASVFNDANSVRQGVREGARQLVVADLDVDGCTGTAAQKVACVTKERIGLDAADTRVRVELASTYQPGEQVTVCAMHQLGSLTGMFGSILDGRVSKSSITMRLEEIDDLSPLVTTSETALPGSDWTWC